VTGTLELMLLSPSRLSTIIVSSTLWANLSALTGSIVFVAFGVVAGLAVAGADLLVIAITVPLTMLATTGLGILAAASVVVLKRGNPLGTAITAACIVLGGVFYPVDALPSPLQVLSALVPTTHALTAIRGAVLGGQDVVALAGPLLALAVLAVASLVVGLVTFAAVIRFARTDGSLGQY
jgi:ABC-2 type transport system permease protein